MTPMTRYFPILLVFGLITVSSTSAQYSDIEAVLDDFHLAASEADSERYFGHLAEKSIFLGTDIMERWAKSEFQGYTEPHFSAGRGWTYAPQASLWTYGSIHIRTQVRHFCLRPRYGTLSFPYLADVFLDPYSCESLRFDGAWMRENRTSGLTSRRSETTYGSLPMGA